MRLPSGEYRESMLDAAYKLWAGRRRWRRLTPRKRRSLRKPTHDGEPRIHEVRRGNPSYRPAAYLRVRTN